MVYLLKKTLIQGKNVILSQFLILSSNRQVKESLKLINKSNISFISILLYISLLQRINVNNINLLPQPFGRKAMESLFRERIYLLKSNSIIKLSFFFYFIIKFTFTSLFFLRAKNWLSFKIIILLVYMPTILNRVPVVIIRKQGLNIKVVLKSFSLQYLL